MLQAKSDQQNLGIKFEFTAPGTPQQNPVVERKFPTLMGRARARMKHAGFDDNFKKRFGCEAVSTAAKLDNIMVKHMGGKPPYCMFFKENPKYRKYLRIIGEIPVVANHEKNSQEQKLNKEENQPCLWDMQMITVVMSTGSLILSRDVRWMNIIWKTYMRKQCINHGLQIIDEDFESDDDDEIQGYWFNQQPEYRDREEIPLLDQERRLGLTLT